MWQGVPFNSSMVTEQPRRDVNRNLIVLNREIEAQKNDHLARQSGAANHENDETKIINVEEDKETKVRLVCSKSDVSFTMSMWLKLDKPKEKLKEDKELGLLECRTSKKIIPIHTNEEKEENELGFLECQSNKKRIPIVANEEFYIGRCKSACRIMVSCKKVSRTHVRIESNSREVFIRLCSKTTNMIINDVVIRPSPIDESYLIKNQDRIQIGPEEFVYLDKNYFQNEKNVDPGGPPGNVDSSSSNSESKLRQSVSPKDILSAQSSQQQAGRVCKWYLQRGVCERFKSPCPMFHPGSIQDNSGMVHERPPNMDQPPLPPGSDSIISGSTTEIKAKLINKDPALAMLNRKSPLDLIKTFEDESTENATIPASTVVTKPIKGTATEMSIKTKSKKKYLAKPEPPTPSIDSVSSNEEHVSPDDVVSVKISSKSPTIWPQPKQLPVKRQPFGAGLKFRGRGVQGRSYGEFLSHQQNSHQILWNNLEEKSQDISQIENRRRETSEEDENSDRIKSKFETVKAIPAAAEDENSFSSRRKKNVIRGFKKRSSPKTTSEVKHEAETIDLRANSARCAGTDSTGSDMVIEKITIIKK